MCIREMAFSGDRYSGKLLSRKIFIILVVNDTALPTTDFCNPDCDEMSAKESQRIF